MSWRDSYRVHPAADVFPMMSDDELAGLVKDITESGLKTPITVDKDGVLLDGRNRLEALERAGTELHKWQVHIYPGTDPVGWIISANVHRRHLTKQQQADLIAAALKADDQANAETEKLCQVGTVSADDPPKGGSGKVKAKAIAEGKKQGIGNAHHAEVAIQGRQTQSQAQNNTAEENRRGSSGVGRDTPAMGGRRTEPSRL
jgi:ParB-like nuclease domain